MYLNFLPGVGGGLSLHLFYLFKEGGGDVSNFFLVKQIYFLFVCVCGGGVPSF